MLAALELDAADITAKCGKKPGDLVKQGSYKCRDGRLSTEARLTTKD